MSTTPFSGWLQKLTTNNTFVASRWQTRFFVVLETELRYYRDEHSATASKTIDLRDVAQITTSLSIHNHPYCFRLEPLQTTPRNKKHKAWTIACRTKEELEVWVSAIKSRLSAYAASTATTVQKPYIPLTSPILQQQDAKDEEVLLSPTVQPFSTPEQDREQPPVSLLGAIMQNESDIVALPTLPPASTLVVKRKKSSACISRRRGVILTPLEIEAIPGLIDASELSYDSASSSSAVDELSPAQKPANALQNNNSFNLLASTEFNLSKNSLLGGEDDQSLIEGKQEEANKAIPQNAYLLNVSSPSFAIYKERFNI